MNSSNNANELDQETVQRYMREVQQFIKNVENTSINIEFDPHNNEEITQCIADMEEAIDAKAKDFAENPTVAKKSAEIKSYFKQQILANAELAKQKKKKVFH